MSFKKKTKKILLVMSDLEIGGTEKHILSIIPLLLKEQILVSICAMNGSGALLEKYENSGAELVVNDIFCKSNRKNWRFLNFFKVILNDFFGLCCLLKALISFRPTIVHFFLPRPYILGGSLSLLFPVKKIMSRRSMNNYQDKYFWLPAFEKYLHKKMDLITANSNYIYRQLLLENIPSEKLVLIYNGIKTNPSFPIECKRPVENKLDIICVANLIGYKGHSDLFHALALLSPELDWTLMCVGRDGGQKKSLVELAERLGIFEKITFTGAVQNPSPYLNEASIGINCSHEEGLPNAVLEYMAHGLAIIVTDVGGNAELIRHKMDGLVVESRNPPQLMEAIKSMSILSERYSYSQSAKKRVEKYFSLTKCGESYAKMYNSLS